VHVVQSDHERVIVHITPLAMMSQYATVEDYVKDRDNALLALDLDFIRNQLGRPASDEMCLMVAHKARYEATRLPAEARHASAQWLRERGLKRMTGTDLLPDGELPE
jgi:hypothetical protein